MKYAVISDVHGNLEALRQVEAALSALPGGYDECLLLGDLVGYNADPAACLARSLRLATHAIRGNHDKVVAGIDSDEDFNPVAQEAARRHRKMLSPEELQRLRELPQGPMEVEPDVIMCHGAPFDEDYYVIDRWDADVCYGTLDEEYPEARVCFFGHTHGAMLFRQEGEKSRLAQLRSGASLDLQEGCRYLINPGSVGQPRDGNPEAAFGVFDSDRRRYTQYRVAYPIAEAQRKIRALGLPESLAARLERGR